MRKLSRHNLVVFGKYLVLQCMSVVIGLLFVSLLSLMWLENNGQVSIYKSRSLMANGVASELYCVAYQLERSFAHIQIHILLDLPRSFSSSHLIAGKERMRELDASWSPISRLSE